MVTALFFSIASFVASVGAAPQAAAEGDSVCYAASVGELLMAQTDPKVVAARELLTSLGDDRFGLQHLLLGFLRVKVEQGEGALLDPEMQRSEDAAFQWNYLGSGVPTVLGFQVCVRVPKGVRARGELWLPVSEGEPAIHGRRLERFPFEFPADAQPVETAKFDEAVQQEAARLALLDVPGKPYFDARARGLKAYDASVAARGGFGGMAGTREDELTQTYELFTGGRALQENLQVDRMRNVAAEGEETVALDSIAGITIDAVDFKKRIAGAEPTIETLAAWVPADQIYVGFPTFGAMTRLLDEMERRGDSLVRTLEPRGEDARTRARLERQLCLSTSFAARLLGPAVVKSVAFTASDPYLREGTDVALLFDCVATLPIEQRLESERADAAKVVAGCASDDFDVRGTKVRGLVAPDRRVSSYSATVGGVVVVSNSRTQITRLIDAHGGEVPVHAKSDEFRFFRVRYPLAPERDAALIVLSDPFLRRFCGPGWRIAESRRLRCAAVLSRLEGLRAAGAKEDAQTLATREQLACPSDAAAQFTFVPGGARCSVHGGAGFLTPVAETPLARATVLERDAYVQFRDRYQQYWRQYFDPIAVEVSPAEPLAIDVTVMPLIAETQYGEFRDFSYGNGELKERAGDPHADSLLHLIVHVNPESRSVRELTGFLTTLPGMEAKGVPWLGDSIEFFVDESPVLDRLKQAREGSDEFNNELAHLPVALRLAIKDPLSFALFLTAGRAMIESSAPGATSWENRTHGALQYVVVKGNPDSGMVMSELAQLQLCYATVSGGFCVTLDEELLKRALDRGKARADAATTPPAEPPAPAPAWLGKHVAFSLDVQRALAVLQPMASRMDEGLDEQSTAVCLGNLPALEAWHLRDPGVDPVEQHADLFGVALVCPDGGTYAWDATIGAVVCSSHGHPLAPRRVDAPPHVLTDLRRISAGITFEEQGVRVRLQAERQK